MQILGSLIELSKAPTELPLPWWYRAPLGLLSGTPVFVALVKTSQRPVGDLVVSVLDPIKWDEMISVECQEEDRPGLIGSVFESVYPLNIAVAEAVTVETGDKHHISLICEPFQEGPHADAETVAQALREKGFDKYKVEPFLDALPPIHWHGTDVVEHGWLRRTNWLQQIHEHYPEGSASVDLTAAVVSADTEKRLMRFVFPRRGAKTVEIQHADRPGALKAIAQAFINSNINVLSALLRRGGARPKNAVLVAICEPLSDTSPDEMVAKLEAELKQIDRRYRADPTIYESKPTREVIYPRHPEELVARAPRSLVPLIRDLQRNVSKGKVPIFLSRRFLSAERRDRIAARVRKILEENGCYPVEAIPEAGQLSTSLLEVSARMWLSAAGIVLVASGLDESFSMNLAHEAGFLQGQGKPVLILVERGSDKSMYEWSNAHGIVAPRFPNDESAFNPDNTESLDKIISYFIKTQVIPS